MMSVVLQNFYLNLDYLEILTIYDILAGQVSGKFCIDLTRPLVQVAVEQGEQNWRSAIAKIIFFVRRGLFLFLFWRLDFSV